MTEKCYQVIAIPAILIIIVFLCPCDTTTVEAQSQTETIFTQYDTFNIIEYNSSIRFGQNGSYAKVELANGIWTFTNLRLNNSQAIGNLSMGAKDCNITIFSLRTSNFTGRSTFIRYHATGVGTQTVNLHPGAIQPTHWSEWAVTTPGASGTIWLSEGKNWDLMSDNTVVVKGLTGNISVTHYNFINRFADSNAPFHIQHSIAIITAIVLAVVIAVSSLIRATKRRN
jgi:hypothetical protein